MGFIFTVRACGYLLGSVAAGLLTDRYPARSKLWIALSLLATAGGAAAVPLSRRSVLGSWVGVRRLFHLSVFLTASRIVLPKILVLTRCPIPRSGIATVP